MGDRKEPSWPPGDPRYKGPEQVRPEPPPAPPRIATAEQAREESRAAFHNEVVMKLAPIFADQFFTSGDAWVSYDDLAESLNLMAAAIARHAMKD